MTHTMPELKNVIIIGASAAGHSVANDLAPKLPATHRILVVERNAFAQYPPSVVRALVVPGWEHKHVTAALSQERVFPTGSRHQLLAPNSVVELKHASVVLETPFEGSTEIPFDKCIIATGAEQAPPMRPVPGSTEAEYIELLRTFQKGIAAAKKILIVGGGAVGVEVAGEIIDTYPDKEVTLVHFEDTLLHAHALPAKENTYVPDANDPALSASLDKQLRALGVHLVLGEGITFPTSPAPGEWDGKSGPLGGVKSLKLTGGGSVDADFVFVSIGNRPNSGLVRAADPGALTTNGYIRVDDHFRVQTSTPDSPLAGDYYALGDVANMPTWKTVVSIYDEAPACAAAVAASVNGKNAKAFKPTPSAAMVVTLGGKGGAGTIPLPWWGNVSAPGFVMGMKNKDFFAGRAFYPRFKGADKVRPAA